MTMEEEGRLGSLAVMVLYRFDATRREKGFLNWSSEEHSPGARCGWSWVWGLGRKTKIAQQLIHWPQTGYPGSDF